MVNLNSYFTIKTGFVWNFFSEYIEKSPIELIVRRRSNKDKQKSINQKKQQNRLSRIAFWGVTITIGGLAIYLWNQ
jgi:hypothetical protein